MERRGRLGDGLAGAAGELLPHGLDDFPLPRHDLDRIRDILAELDQLSAAARAGGGRGKHYALTRQMVGQGRPGRLTARRRALGRLVLARGVLRLGGVLAGGGDEFAEFQLELVDQLAAALRRGAETVMLELGDEQLEMRHHRLGADGTRLGLLPRQLRGRERGAQGGDVGGSGVRRGRHGVIESRPTRQRQSKFLVPCVIRQPPAAKFVAGCANRFRRACRPAARRRSTHSHPSAMAR
jgi:hypothetical protein